MINKIEEVAKLLGVDIGEKKLDVIFRAFENGCNDILKLTFDVQDRTPKNFNFIVEELLARSIIHLHDVYHIEGMEND